MNPIIIPEMPSSAVHSSGKVHTLRALGRFLLGGVGATVLAMFLPFQQSVASSGRVIAYAPLERQQTVEAPIYGRVKQWYVQEGQQVNRGQKLAEISDNDPAILDRLSRERDAAQAQLSAVTLSLELAESRIQSLEQANGSAVQYVTMEVRVAKDGRDAKRRKVEAARAALQTAKLNYRRKKKLHEEGLASTRDFELALLKVQTSRSYLEQSVAELNAASAKVGALAAGVSKTRSDNQAKVEKAKSSLEKLRAEEAKAQAALVKTEVKLARQQRMVVVAPRAGTVLRLLAKQDTEMVKSGDPLLSLVPKTHAHAAEIFVDGRDAPLVQAGRKVRLQFEGWPAAQFVGWPAAAIGTWPGRVAFVDAQGDSQGRFRVVVVPESEKDWPHGNLLRQGMRATAWVLVNRVSLGYELWRLFNGFPPLIERLENEDSGAGPGKGGKK